MSEPSTALAPRQAGVLAARYRAAMVGDWPTVLLLVAQAPLIGWFCTVVWGSVGRDTPSLYFVMSLSAVWFGCINACREIVKERSILERERFFGLSLGAYVRSKLSVLAWLGLVQVVLMQGAIEWKIALHGNYLIETLAMWAASLTGTALGLLVSAVARTQERAVGAIPLLILPQILFSEFAIPRKNFGAAVEWIERLMPVKWAYKMFVECAAKQPSWGAVFGSLLVLLLFSAGLGLATRLALIPRQET